MSIEQPGSEANRFEGAIRELEEALEYLPDSLDDNKIRPANLERLSQARTGFRLFKKLPADLDESMSSFRDELLTECEKGLTGLRYKEELEEELKEKAIFALQKLRSLYS